MNNRENHLNEEFSEPNLLSILTESANKIVQELAWINELSDGNELDIDKLNSAKRNINRNFKKLLNDVKLLPLNLDKLQAAYKDFRSINQIAIKDLHVFLNEIKKSIEESMLQIRNHLPSLDTFQPDMLFTIFSYIPNSLSLHLYTICHYFNKVFPDYLNFRYTQIFKTFCDEETRIIDVTKTDEDGNTILFWALKYQQSLADVKYLITQGAEVNCFNNDFETPIYLAAAMNDQSVITYLMDCGADIHLRPSEQMLKARGKTYIVGDLEGRGYTIAPTPLELAFINTHCKVADTLALLVTTLPPSEDGKLVTQNFRNWMIECVSSIQSCSPLDMTNIHIKNLLLVSIAKPSHPNPNVDMVKILIKHGFAPLDHVLNWTIKHKRFELFKGLVSNKTSKIEINPNYLFEVTLASLIDRVCTTEDNTRDKVAVFLGFCLERNLIDLNKPNLAISKMFFSNPEMKYNVPLCEAFDKDGLNKDWYIAKSLLDFITLLPNNKKFLQECMKKVIHDFIKKIPTSIDTQDFTYSIHRFTLFRTHLFNSSYSNQNMLAAANALLDFYTNDESDVNLEQHKKCLDETVYGMDTDLRKTYLQLQALHQHIHGHKVDIKRKKTV